MAEPKYILEQWDKFSVITGVALQSSVQRKEMRRAFYSGVEAFLKIIF